MLTDEEEIIWSHGRTGFCTLEKVRHMLQLVVQEKPNLCVEVGVYGGRSLFPMAYGCHKNGRGQVHAIDSWSNADSSDGEQGAYAETWKTHDFESKYQEFIRDAARPPYDKIVKTFRVNHLNVVDSYGSESIGFFHEDGNHSPKIVNESLVRWLPKLMVDGIFVWDDPGWADNSKLVHNVHSNYGLLLLEQAPGYHVLRKVKHIEHLNRVHDVP